MITAIMQNHAPFFSETVTAELLEQGEKDLTCARIQELKAMLPLVCNDEKYATSNSHLSFNNKTTCKEINYISPLEEQDDTSLIERQLSLINHQIIKSLESSMSIMDDIRLQAKTVQDKMQKIGSLPKPILELSQNVLNNILETVDREIFESSLPEELTSNQRRPSGKVIFPVKLHQLLLDLEYDKEASGIAMFLDDGLAFTITSASKFEDVVLAKYFPRMNSFRSFHRQLNLYEFKRLGKSVFAGKGEYIYCHPLFRKDKPELAALMRPSRPKKV